MQRNPHSYQIATGYRTFYSLSLIYQPITKKRLFFSKRKGGKDILRFPIKGDDSVNRVNNSVVELSGKYSLSNDR